MQPHGYGFTITNALTRQMVDYHPNKCWQSPHDLFFWILLKMGGLPEHLAFHIIGQVGLLLFNCLGLKGPARSRGELKFTGSAFNCFAKAAIFTIGCLL